MFWKRVRGDTEQDMMRDVTFAGSVLDKTLIKTQDCVFSGQSRGAKKDILL